MNLVVSDGVESFHLSRALLVQDATRATALGGEDGSDGRWGQGREVARCWSGLAVAGVAERPSRRDHGCAERQAPRGQAIGGGCDSHSRT